MDEGEACWGDGKDVFWVRRGETEGLGGVVVGGEAVVSGGLPGGEVGGGLAKVFQVATPLEDEQGEVTAFDESGGTS